MAESNIMDKTGVLIEQLGKAFHDLESHKEAAEDKVLWKEIEEHFCQLQTTMVKQLSELESKEKAFKEEESEFYSFLEVREANVAAKEQDMMDRIQELKNEAVAAIAETYLKDLRRNSQGKKGGAGGGQKDANAQELAALKVVIQCVHDYNLEADYPLDPLHRRVAQLEKAKPDKKRFGESGKNQQAKKPRTNGGFRAPPAAATVVSRQAPAYTGERAYAGIAERFPRAVQDPYTYQAPTQSTYGQPGYDHRSYYYPHGERVAAPTYTAYNTAPPSYASYTSSGMPTSHPSYI